MSKLTAAWIETIKEVIYRAYIAIQDPIRGIDFKQDHWPATPIAFAALRLEQSGAAPLKIGRSLPH
jgi:hypothetical protein